MSIKNEGNENKIMLGGLNCTMDKIDRDGENKTRRLYSCCSNYAMSKLIVDNGLKDLWRRENPDSPELICCDMSFANDQYRLSYIIIMLFLLTDSPQKLKSENIHDTLIIILYVSPRSPQLQRHSFFYYLTSTQISYNIHTISIT